MTNDNQVDTPPKAPAPNPDAPKAPAPKPDAPKASQASGASAPRSSSPGGATAKPNPSLKKKAAQKKKAAKQAAILKKTADVIPQNYMEEARARRRKQSISLARRFSALVVLPTLIAAAYYAFWASDIYQSTAVFHIQSSDIRTATGIESMLGTFGGGSASKDAMLVQGFILSRDMLRKLDKEHNLIAHYQQQQWDVISRLKTNASFEEAFAYYLKVVEAKYDNTSAGLTLSVKSYDPKMSHAVANSILAHSEETINRFSERIRNDQVAFAEQSVDKAETRLRAAQQAIVRLQQKEADFSPDRSAATLISVKSQLEAELAKVRTELNSLRGIMAPTAPKVLELSRRAQSLQTQIKQENKRLLGSDESGLGASIIEFETAMVEKGFAEKEYTTAMASVEMARLEAMKQSRYLVTVATPTVPDEATYPSRILGTLTFFLIVLALFGIGSLLIAATREHARI